jgi:hypothetical protein
MLARFVPPVPPATYTIPFASIVAV